jgi:hypothetical protein
MALNRDKFRKIVGGITTAAPKPAADAVPLEAKASEVKERREAGEGSQPSGDTGLADEARTGDHRRFAKRGRPKASKDAEPAGKGRKVKVSLFLSEVLVNDLYEWAHDDRIHPGEMFERALKPFHERETKRRKGGKE